jgi:hypothetical protein
MTNGEHFMDHWIKNFEAQCLKFSAHLEDHLHLASDAMADLPPLEPFGLLPAARAAMK